ncbi:MAG TPA: carboxypeptidase-like regulatory domain-containing protein [Gemmatimonadales bacterium]|nr:carboxypeptidase-like regulatory domain-containing protein [Gemmatimonadales bacterium]
MLDAQSLRGRVMGSGQPVADAVVALWGATRELTRTATGAGGDFTLQLSPNDTAYTLAVRAIGFQQQWIPLAAVDTAHLVVTLPHFALALPELAAEATARRCPVPDDPGAHQLWQALAARYTLPPPGRGMAARVRQWTATVGAAEVGALKEAQLHPVLQGISGVLRAAAAGSIDSFGYARRIAPPFDQLLALASTNDLYFQWWYPSLDTWDYEQWLAPAFGRRHTLTAVALATGAWDLVFCPREDRHPGLAGVMRVGADSTLESVTWEVRTKSPRERPGGRVEFGTLAGPTIGLQPLRSVYWRLVGGSKDRYLQRVTVFSELVVSEADSSPRLRWTE